MSKSFPPGPRISDHLQPDRVHLAVDRRGAATRCSKRSLLVVLVDHRLPAELARGGHPGRRHPGVADRHLRGAAGARLFAQQPVAVRPGAGDRHRRRRRDRRGRECRAKPRARTDPRWRPRARRWTRSSTALVAIVLVLCAVFVPTLFLTGLSGAFYRQFAVTISAATMISLLLSLTLVAGARGDAAEAARASTRRAIGLMRIARGARATASTQAFDRFSERYSPPDPSARR